MAISNVSLTSVANDLQSLSQELSTLTSQTNSTSSQGISDPTTQNTIQSLSNSLNEAMQSGNSQATNLLEQAMQSVLQGSNSLGSGNTTASGQGSSADLAKDEYLLSAALQSGNANPAFVNAMEGKIAQDLNATGSQGTSGTGNFQTAQHPNIYSALLSRLMSAENSIGNSFSSDSSDNNPFGSPVLGI